MAIHLTPAAADRVRSFLTTRGHGEGLRLGIKKTGCSGWAWVVDYADAVNPEDAVFEAEGVKVWSLVGNEDSFLKVWAERCAQEKISGVLVEAGPRLASAMLASGSADYLYAFVAPRTGDAEAPSWHDGVALPVGGLRTSLVGSDALYQGHLG